MKELNKNASSYEDGRDNLLQLAYLRWIAILGTILTILVVHFELHIPLQLEKMSGVIFLQIISNIYSHSQ